MTAAAPTFFKTATAFRAWLARHAAKETELIVGFYKRSSGHASITWPESVDEALCHGWIDGVRTRIDDEAYKIRFTPRKATSIWSAVNIKRVEELQTLGRMKKQGLDAFARRKEAKSGIYAHEQAEPAILPQADAAVFRKNRKAWKFFEAQPPSYRHRMVWRIISAKREETKASRLANLIDASAEERRL
ncbi:MAG: bacteriocin-protection protein [Comamonadaceae bacterium]|nr:MAG: bacteriocin-protection protein [Comamonadaceae bacterium]